MNALVSPTVCAVCTLSIEGARVEKFRRGKPCYLHPDCWARVESDQRAADQRARLETQKGIRESFEYMATQPGLDQRIGGLPTFPFARLDNADFRKRVSRKLLAGVERYDLSMPLMVSGPTGVGKSSLMEAKMHKLLDIAIAGAKPVRGGALMAKFSPRFVFLAGYELASARRGWKLGEESPIVVTAKDVEFLILDEVGFEPLTELVFEVLDHRYRAQRVTVVTTGLRPAEFRDRYGDAAFRRLAEGGAVLEDW